MSQPLMIFCAFAIGITAGLTVITADGPIIGAFVIANMFFLAIYMVLSGKLFPGAAAIATAATALILIT